MEDRTESIKEEEKAVSGLLRILPGGRYGICRQIAAGGTGRVYLGTDLHLNLPVAIKEMELSGDRERQMASNEMKYLRDLRHPILPKILDYIEEADKAYLIMEYVDGENLDTCRKAGRFCGEEEVLLKMREVAMGLDYLHHLSPPMVYQDLKPENIMLTERGEVRLIDLGGMVQKRYDGNHGMVCGTAWFSAPEQRAVHPASDERSDIYSFGRVLVVLLGADRTEEIGKTAHSIRRRVGCSVETAKLIRDCCETDPAMRIGNGGELIRRIDHCIRVIENEKKKKRAVRGRRKQKVISAVALFLIIGTLIWTLEGRMIEWEGIMPGWLSSGSKLIERVREMIPRNSLLAGRERSTVAILLGILMVMVLTVRHIKRRKRAILKNENSRLKHIFLSEGIQDRFLVILLAAALFGSVCIPGREVLAADEGMFLTIYDENGRKVLVPYEEIYETNGSIRMEIGDTELEPGLVKRIDVILTDEETGRQRRRTLRVVKE